MTERKVVYDRFSLTYRSSYSFYFTCVTRDKLTSDDCIGTRYIPVSAISGQGEEGASLILFVFRRDRRN